MKRICTEKIFTFIDMAILSGGIPAEQDPVLFETILSTFKSENLKLNEKVKLFMLMLFRLM